MRRDGLQIGSILDEDWGAFLREIPGTPIAVQYAAPHEEIADLERVSGRKIVVPENLDQKNEIDRTAAMLSALDVVVSAPTAVSWLAAAAGVPVLKILSNPSWTNFGESFEPFAPAAKCCVPSNPGDWHESFDIALAAIPH